MVFMLFSTRAPGAFGQYSQAQSGIVGGQELDPIKILDPLKMKTFHNFTKYRRLEPAELPWSALPPAGAAEGHKYVLQVPGHISQMLSASQGLSASTG